MFLKPLDKKNILPIEIIKADRSKRIGNETYRVFESWVYSIVYSTSPRFHYAVMFPQRSNLP